MSDIHDFMKKSELFAGLNPDTSRSISRRLKPVRFAAGEIVCQEGDDGNSMFVIVKGEVTIGKDLGWGQRELDRLRPGDAFGEMALISKERRTATVRVG